MKLPKIKRPEFLTPADYWLQFLMWLMCAGVFFKLMTGAPEVEVNEIINIYFIVWSSMNVSLGVATIERHRMKERRRVKKIRFIR